MTHGIVQFALSNPYEEIEESGLLPVEEAESLFRSHLDEYRHVLQNQPHREPEMALWVDCEHDSDYHTAKYHLSHHDTEIDRSGRLVQITKTYF